MTVLHYSSIVVVHSFDRPFFVHMAHAAPDTYWYCPFVNTAHASLCVGAN
jgi:hypothetical protein